MKLAASVSLIFLIVVAAGFSTALAQETNVSVNVASRWNLVANPLSNGTNGANQIFAPIDGEVILTWGGSGFSYVGYDSAFGWIDANFSPASPPFLPPGKGFALF